MNRKIIFCSLFGLISVHTFGQRQKTDTGDKTRQESSGNKETMNYESISDDPSQLKILYLTLPLWEGSYSKTSTSIYDLNVSANYLDKRFIFSANLGLSLGDKVLYGYGDGSDYVNNREMIGVNSIQHAQTFAVRGTYNILSKIIVRDVVVNLKRVGKTQYVANIPANNSFRLGLNLGFDKGFRSYNLNNTPINVSNGSNEVETINLETMYTTQIYSLISGGLTFSQAKSIKIKTDRFGVKTHDVINYLSVNALYAVNNSFEDVYVSRPAYADPLGGFQVNSPYVYSKYSLNSSNKKTNLGFEAVFKTINKDAWFSFYLFAKFFPGLAAADRKMFGGGAYITINALKD